MPANYDRQESKVLAEAAKQGKTLPCPACGGGMSRQELPPSRADAYVRRRVLLICGACRRSLAVDLGPAGRR